MKRSGLILALAVSLPFIGMSKAYAGGGDRDEVPLFGEERYNNSWSTLQRRAARDEAIQNGWSTSGFSLRSLFQSGCGGTGGGTSVDILCFDAGSDASEFSGAAQPASSPSVGASASQPGSSSGKTAAPADSSTPAGDSKGKDAVGGGTAADGQSDVYSEFDPTTGQDVIGGGGKGDDGKGFDDGKGGDGKDKP